MGNTTPDTTNKSTDNEDDNEPPAKCPAISSISPSTNVAVSAGTSNMASTVTLVTTNDPSLSYVSDPQKNSNATTVTADATKTIASPGSVVTASIACWSVWVYPPPWYLSIQKHHLITPVLWTLFQIQFNPIGAPLSTLLEQQ